MPEYLTPAVYVEETSFRSRSIEGVPTSTFGMAGVTEYGPVPVPSGAVPLTPAPTLVTSLTEYERAFGGLSVAGAPCRVAIAARAFFANGGRRLYVSRVFSFTRTAGPNPQIDDAANFASLAAPATGTPLARWRARWPGSFGRQIKITVALRRSRNVLVGGQLVGLQPGAAVETAAAGAAVPANTTAPAPANVQIIARAPDGRLGYRAANGVTIPPANTSAWHLTLVVTVQAGERVDAYSELELDPAHPRSIFNVLQRQDPPDEFALVWLDSGAATPPPGQLVAALLTPDTGLFLTGGGDGLAVTPGDLIGREADPDKIAEPATGLTALGEIDDIAIVAMPDTVDLPVGDQKTAVDGVLGHCERLRYRMAIVDPPRDSSISEVREFRSKFDNKYGALYYPWVRIIDPTRKPDPGGPTPMLDVPPSGYVAGIYARSDIERGVHKAPANEVVLGIDRFVTNVTFDRQSVLNPEGINALRFFEGRANRVWGARTMSSDPEWKYVNVRRLFIFLEHSIDKSTQWAVFEPNNERLWASIRQTVEDFLRTVWRTGALMGTRPEEAFFVRCDRTTMTQNDLDNGRLICLVGVAPTYPAEFVIFRIGQWTADSQSS
ncbi:phage tail sheath subtilisin-like domain-containing protein [Micromonospora soli]|uniref:phage tail sheath family protein n=1 Tax=Micromonospora sp. NBRC 110009 TaxID=3061627 RepID=UPI00267320EE|nr:phage tail sheath subtilisin-like domain-containing protein [Micromonospora sp. NBRC 110009]WKT96882.1 phage tail sheath subtilisin-like domain-containing protein [Micromonospora sp. NBRC 110009]